MLLNSLIKFFDIEFTFNWTYHNFFLFFVEDNFVKFFKKNDLFICVLYLFKNKKMHYLNIFRLFLRIISLRIAKSRRDLFVIWLNSRFRDIKARIKKLALRNNKDESMSFKTNFCFFLFREVRTFFIIRVMINVNKIFSLSKNIFASKNKKAISFKNRWISFFWMTSSFR
jgi:hypothetical protein